MCLNPIAIPSRTGSEYVFVPCGKCPECLKTLGNEFAVRVVREAQSAKSFHFVTLTYRDDTLPIYEKLVPVDNETGELLYHFKSGKVLSGRTLCEARESFLASTEYQKTYLENGKCIKRYLPYTIHMDDPVYPVVATYFPTVNNKDFQNAMKRFRKYNSGLEFKYACVPEYSGHTYRPHYHCLFFGLSDDKIGEFCDYWQKKFGYTDIQRVTGSMTDISKVAKYVGTYTYKGKYDLNYIKMDFCVKPHRMMSEHFGYGDQKEFERLVSYYKCEDIYGKYDADDVSFLENHKYSIVDDILERRAYYINGFKYPLPKYIQRKIFFRYEERKNRRGEKVKTYRATYLQQLVTSSIFEHLRSDSNRERERYERYLESLGSDFQQSMALEVASQKIQRNTVEENFINKIHTNKKL